MKFFTFSEICLSVFYAFAFGLAFGFVSSLIKVFFLYLNCILQIPSKIWRISSNFSLKKIKEETKIKSESLNNVLCFFKDFISVTAFGVAFILISYIANDGVFRFYMLVISVLCAYLSKRTLGSIFEKASIRIFSFIYAACLVGISFIFLPIYKFFGLIQRISAPLVSKLLTKLRSIRIKKKNKPNAALPDEEKREIKVYKFHHLTGSHKNGEKTIKNS